MFANVGAAELIIIAIVIFLLFGGKKLPELAKGLTNATKEFNKGLNSEDEDKEKDKEEDEKEDNSEEKD